MEFMTVEVTNIPICNWCVRAWRKGNRVVNAKPAKWLLIHPALGEWYLCEECATAEYFTNATYTRQLIIPRGDC